MAQVKYSQAMQNKITLLGSVQPFVLPHSVVAVGADMVDILKPINTQRNKAATPTKGQTN